MSTRQLVPASLLAVLLLLPFIAAWGQEAEPPATVAESPVLVPGDPPLTEDLQQRFCLLLEWVLDAQFTDAQRAELMASSVEAWTTGSADDRESVVQMAQLQAALPSVSEEERALYRQVVQEQLLTAARENPTDEGMAWLLGVYDAAHKPLAEGPPALTRQMTDAFSEMLAFMIAQVTDTQDMGLGVDSATKDEFATSVAAQWPELPAEGKEQYTSMPLMWATLNAAWPTMAEEDRQKLRDQWREQLLPVLPAQQAAGADQGAVSTPQVALAPGDELPLDSQDAAGYLARGTQYLEKGTLGAAIADFTQALTLAPRSVPVMLARAKAFSRDGRKDDALKDLIRAAHLDPESVEAQKALYDHYYEQSATDLARKHWNRMRELKGEPASDDAWALEMQGQLQASQLRFQTMSNVLRMQHETNMMIINNIGGWSTTYRYY